MTDQPAVEPYRFTAPLTVCVDPRHALAYLALQPLQALAQELGIHIDWLPFAAPGLKAPPAPAPDRGTRHRRARARYQASEIQRYAEVQGLVIREPFRDVDSTPALLGHLWLRQQAAACLPDYLLRVFRDHWGAALDIGNPEAVAGALDDLGLDVEKFLAFLHGPGPAALDELRHRLAAAGVFTVPSLIAAGEVFVGRAHLPLVRRLLS
jgi:2-hydroxychromene-2-carboxylate isomerase